MTDQQQPLAAPAEGQKQSSERFAKACFFVGSALLLFLTGGILAHTNATYSRFLGSAVAAYRATIVQDEIIAEEYPRFLWYPEPSPDRGLLKYDSARSFPGYTLCLAGSAGKAQLLDHGGEEVFHWDARFNEIWPNPEHIERKTPDSFYLIRRGYVFPNGDLLAQFESPVHTPNGCGIARFDKNGRVLWKFDANAHHDFDVAADGTIFALTQTIREEPLGDKWQFVRQPFLDESVSILSADGIERKTLSLFELLEKSKYFRSDTTSSTYYGDVLHSNTVHVIGESFAAHYEEISPDDLMICLRNLNLVIVVNPQREEIVWATSGPWGFPHDPDPLPNGNIMIFDNCFFRGSLEGSRVLEFVPDQTGTVVWQYSGAVNSPLRSTVRAAQQVLPNDNVLITESDRGRILEVSRSGEIVWEYVHPARGGSDGTLIPVVCGARRYSAEELPFLSKSEEPAGVQAAE